jgi:hypothetical protein
MEKRILNDPVDGLGRTDAKGPQSARACCSPKKRAKSVTQISDNLIKRPQPDCRAIPFFLGIRAGKLDPRSGSGLLGRTTAFDQWWRVRIDMKLQLRFDIVVDQSAMRQRAPSGPKPKSKLNDHARSGVASRMASTTEVISDHLDVSDFS